jgi:hypothetical protein
MQGVKGIMLRWEGWLRILGADSSATGYISTFIYRYIPASTYIFFLILYLDVSVTLLLSTFLYQYCWFVYLVFDISNMASNTKEKLKTDNDQLKLKKISAKKSEPNYKQENKSCSCTKLRERKNSKCNQVCKVWKVYSISSEDLWHEVVSTRDRKDQCERTGSDRDA